MRHQTEPHLNWGSASFATELTALRDRVEEARAAALGRSDRLLVEDLATAYEELRVADAELRAQQEHIVGLLRDRHDFALQHQRTMALIPVPMVSTDRSGVIRAANAAAATLCGAAVPRLVGKPLAVLVAPEDRRAVRDTVSRGPAEDGTVRRRLTVRRRGGGRVDIEAFASPSAGDPTGWDWILLDAGVSHGDTGARLPTALINLVSLTGREVGAAELLREALRCCQEVLGDEFTVSVALSGSEESPLVLSASQAAPEIDQVQLAAAAGPMLSAWETGVVVETDDMTADPRWPDLRGRLRGEERAAVSVPFEIGAGQGGVLSVYAEPSRLLGPIVEQALLLASALGIALQELQARDELQTSAREVQSALESGSLIDEAGDLG